MSASKIQIANLALQKLGAKRISSLTQDHPNARSINAAYDYVRQKELRAYDWSFAKRRASIAADASQTLWGTHNRYTLPNDYLYLILDNETGTAVDWQIESDASGKYIVTNDAAPLKIKYIADIDDPTYYDAMFIEVMACTLAAHCCEEITGSPSKENLLQNERKMAIDIAYQTGAIEKAAEDFPIDDWLTARY